MTSICHGKSSFQFSGFRFQKNIYMYISSRFIENQPNEICSHLSEKASKGRLFGPDKLQNHIEGKGNDKEKEREGRKEEKRKKAMVALLVFIMATLKIVFGRKKKLLDAKCPFGGIIFKNPG